MFNYPFPRLYATLSHEQARLRILTRAIRENGSQGREQKAKAEAEARDLVWAKAMFRKHVKSQCDHDLALSPQTSWSLNLSWICSRCGSYVVRYEGKTYVGFGTLVKGW